jgi:hypothetical protein
MSLCSSYGSWPSWTHVEGKLTTLLAMYGKDEDDLICEIFLITKRKIKLGVHNFYIILNARKVHVEST